jgi:hypothetical protein
MPPFQPPGFEPAPGQKKPLVKQWWFWVAVVVVLALIGGVAGQNGSDDGQAGARSTAAPTTTQEQATPPPASPSAAPPTTTTPEAPAPGAPPEQYSGAGASVVTLSATDPRILTISHNGGSNFVVYSVDAQGQDIDLLVNEIGSYSGVLPLNFMDGAEAAALKIEADGQWNVTSAPLSSAPSWDGNAPFSAEGAAVVWVAGAAEGLTPVTLTHQGESNFVAIGYGDGQSLLVNEIGAYTGETLLPAGTLVLTVEADGPWSIAKS